MCVHSNMPSTPYCIEISIMADLIILWFVAFNVFMEAPSPICNLLLSSDGLTPECLYLDVKFLWEVMSWHQPSKPFSSRSVILFASETLASAIIKCGTSLIVIKDGSCTVSCISGSISVSWTLLRNASTRIFAIPANKYSSSSLCEPFTKQTEWGSQLFEDVRNIRGQSYNCCCVCEDVSSQTIVPDI